MRAFWIALPVFVVSAANGALAAEPALLTAWHGVVAHSPEFAAARARREAGAAAREAARALWMPTLGAQGGVGYQSFDSVTTGAQFSAPGFGTSNGADFRSNINGGTATQWSLLAEQPLFDNGRKADSDGARARARIAEAQFRQAEQSLMVKTAEALASVVETGARFRAVQRQRQSAIRAREFAHERFQAGDLPVTEWREAQAQADQLAVQELDAQRAYAIANEAYANLTGLAPPDGPVDVDAPPTMAVPATAADSGADVAPTAPSPVEDWLRRARTSSPVLAAQREQQTLAEAETRRFSPLQGVKVSLVGEYSRQSITGSGDYGDAGYTQRIAGVGLQVTVPIFSGGMRAAQRHAADASLRAADADVEAVGRQVELQVRAAWLTAGTARARLAATLRAQQSAETRLDATRVGHDAGDRTMLDLLAAEGAALQARAEAIGARCDGLLATLRLAAAAGTLDEPALATAAAGEFTCGDPAAP